jgi:two-component system nitrate/nitrite sensor histidine kinase NarX
LGPQRRDRRGIAAGAVAERGAQSGAIDSPVAGEEADVPAWEPAPPNGPATLAPMLAAIVRMTGASAAVLRLAASDPARLELAAAVGLTDRPAQSATGVMARLCAGCPEADQPDADCVRGGLCGRDERFPADLSGRACKHMVAVSLRAEDRPIGALNLRFPAPGGLPAATLRILDAAADLVATCVEHDRVARETLRTSLTSERQMMANEVHDSLAQGLTYMRMRMSLLRDAVREGDHVRAFKYWSDVDIALTNAHRRLRELITYFRSRMDPQGLLHALQETSETFLDRTGVALEFANRVPDLDLPVGREVQVFHIVQEALANVCKHANARRARLTLDRKDAGYEIVVEDDGAGMRPEAAAGERGDAGHYGIAIMRERARRLGGELTLESAPGAGTRVRLYFPAMESHTERGL